MTPYPAQVLSYLRSRPGEWVAMGEIRAAVRFGDDSVRGFGALRVVLAQLGGQVETRGGADPRRPGQAWRPGRFEVRAVAQEAKPCH